MTWDWSVCVCANVYVLQQCRCCYSFANLMPLLLCLESRAISLCKKKEFIDSKQFCAVVHKHNTQFEVSFRTLYIPFGEAYRTTFATWLPQFLSTSIHTHTFIVVSIFHVSIFFFFFDYRHFHCDIALVVIVCALANVYILPRIWTDDAVSYGYFCQLLYEHLKNPCQYSSTNICCRRCHHHQNWWTKSKRGWQAAYASCFISLQ